MYLKVTYLVTLIVILTSPLSAKKYSKDCADLYQLDKEYQEFLEWKEQRESKVEGKNIQIKSYGPTLPASDFNDKNERIHKSYTKQESEINHAYQSPKLDEENVKWNTLRSSENYRDERNPATLLEDKQSKEDTGKNNGDSRQDLPPISDGALMGRYIVNQADWTAASTISTRNDIQSFPTANVISFSDGPLDQGSGIPYMYLTPLDFTAQDVMKDSRSSLLMTLAQGEYCRNMTWDPMDPRCARIILSGHIEPLKNDSAEYGIAKEAVFTRHPKLSGMPADHHFFFAKLEIKSIAVLDTFGGPKYVPVEDYLHPSKPNITEQFMQRFPSNQPYTSGFSSLSMDALKNDLPPTIRLV